MIDTNFHYVLEAAHPSPLSAYNGFMGCGHFKYIVSSEARIGDVIELAMGFTENADTSNINLALKVEDGMQIIVYTYYVDTGEVKNLVNINTATVDELMKLPGIGEVKAKAIVEYRKKNGWFNDISELKNVSGISESLFEQIKELITV